MESRQLRYFCEIAEAGSFSAAAARLRVAQPALSRQIAALEKDLGAAVFHRGPSGVRLTVHGEILLRHADAMRVHAARAREEISTTLGHATGWVSFGTSPVLGSLVFGPVAEAMAKHYPGLRISFIEGVSATLVSGLYEGTLDIALTSRPAHAPGIAFEKTFSEAVYLVGAQGMPMPKRVSGWHDLHGIPLVVTNQQTTMASWVEELSGPEQSELDFRYRVESSRAAVGLIERGLAFGVLPQSTLRDLRPDAGFQAVEFETATLDRYLAYPREREQTPVFQTMKDVIVAAVGTVL